MRNILLFGFLALGLFVTACNDDDHDDDHDHEVTIEFLEPTDDETVAAPDDVHVHVRITAEDEIHDVEIKMYPHDNEDDLIIDHDAHSHESSYDFEGDYDLSAYPSGTEFHLEVKAAKDHDGTEYEEEDIHFKLP